ncbi:MAG: DNA polymerase III subunit epsilon [Pseudomonadota bacterium]
MRQIVMDTETTGIEVAAGHRLIEIGGVELLDRRPTGLTFHRYLNPDREIDTGAIQVHGITRQFLVEQGAPRFKEIADELIEFLTGAELVIHNASFDLGFLNAELTGLGRQPIESHCPRILDTLALARRQRPGQRNSLDALCKFYGIDNSQRTHHGALIDARILVEVYLAMTGGQAALALGDEESGMTYATPEAQIRRLSADRPRFRVIRANAVEHQAHAALLARMKNPQWETLTGEGLGGEGLNG